MLYLKTLNVWDTSIQQAIVNGQIKLQIGQWLTCGVSNDKKSRFVGIMGNGVLWLVHWQGSPKATNRKFKQAVQAFNRRC